MSQLLPLFVCNIIYTCHLIAGVSLFSLNIVWTACFSFGQHFLNFYLTRVRPCNVQYVWNEYRKSKATQWRNWGSALGVIALPSTKKLASFKRIILRIIFFVLPHSNVCPTGEKSNYVLILFPAWRILLTVHCIKSVHNNC